MGDLKIFFASIYRQEIEAKRFFLKYYVSTNISGNIPGVSRDT